MSNTPTGKPMFKQQPTFDDCRHAIVKLMDVINWRQLKLDVRTLLVLTKFSGEADGSYVFVERRSKATPAAVADSTPSPEMDVDKPTFPSSVTAKTEATVAATDVSIDNDDSDFWNKASSEQLPPDGLSPEQGRIWSQVMSGKSVFITGPAGTGKTHLLNVLIAELQKKYPPSSVYVTASTGVAATHVSGTTIHSFAGAGIDLDENWGLKVKKISKAARSRWESCKVLIIDEISMVNAKLFDLLDYLARNIRNRRDEPFGGIQVLACGDFFQLPPVYKKTQEEKDREAAARRARRERANDCFDCDDDNYDDSEEVVVNDAAKFAFEPSQYNAWAKVFGKNQFSLTTSFRQKDDVFVNILNNIRKGDISPEDFCRLNECVRTVFPKGIEPIYLSPHHDTVDKHNQRELGKVATREYTYNALDTPDKTKMLDSNTLAASKLTLKPGAQVLLLKNLDVAAGLVNGARGRIVAMSDELECSDSDNDDDDGNEDRMDCDNDKKGVVTKDQRKTKKGDPSWPEPPGYLKTNGFDSIPLVRFEKKTPEYPNGLLKWIVPQTFNLMSGEVIIAQRTQLPLILGYAVTIHKSQGMTLKYAQIDVKEVFAPGQAYVAFSRVESIKGLKITERFEEHVIHAHPKAIAYQQALESGSFELE